MTETVGLVAEGVTAGYRDISILHGVSLEVPLGRVTAMIGPNGSGKSTMLRAVCGLLPVRSGRIVLDGQDITGFSTRSRLERGLAFVPQEHSVFAHMTVHENMLLGAWMWRRTHKEVRSRIEEAYATFPMLEALSRRPAGMLSGGQQKLLELARAMVSQPRLLVVDEPTAGLSPRASEEVYRMLEDITRGGRIGILLVDQNVREALRLASYVYVLAYGRNDTEGDAEAISHRLAEVVRGWLGPRAAAETVGAEAS